MTRISSRDLANQFIENPKLTKLKRFYVYTMIGKKKCRVLDLRNINGEQRLVLVLYVKPKEITNPKLSINDQLIFEENDNIDDEDDAFPTANDEYPFVSIGYADDGRIYVEYE